jgi:hypothetical protein
MAQLGFLLALQCLFKVSQQEKSQFSGEKAGVLEKQADLQMKGSTIRLPGAC